VVFEINLLPEKYRKKKIAIQLDSRMLAIIGGVVVVALIGWLTISQSKKLSALETRVEELTMQRDELAPKAQRVDRNRREIESLTTRINTLQGLGTRNQIQLQILEIVKTQMPDDLWLLDLNQNELRQQQGVARIARNRIVNFRGRAMRKERITEFIARLQGENLIQRVMTTFMRPVRVEDADIFEFEITAYLAISGS